MNRKVKKIIKQKIKRLHRYLKNKNLVISVETTKYFISLLQKLLEKECNYYAKSSKKLIIKELCKYFKKNHVLVLSTEDQAYLKMKRLGKYEK